MQNSKMVACKLKSSEYRHIVSTITLKKGDSLGGETAGSWTVKEVRALGIRRAPQGILGLRVLRQGGIARDAFHGSIRTVMNNCLQRYMYLGVECLLDDKLLALLHFCTL